MVDVPMKYGEFSRVTVYQRLAAAEEYLLQFLPWCLVRVGTGSTRVATPTQAPAPSAWELEGFCCGWLHFAHILEISRGSRLSWLTSNFAFWRSRIKVFVHEFDPGMNRGNGTLFSWAFSGPSRHANEPEDSRAGHWNGIVRIDQRMEWRALFSDHFTPMILAPITQSSVSRVQSIACLEGVAIQFCHYREVPKHSDVTHTFQHTRDEYSDTLVSPYFQAFVVFSLVQSAAAIKHVPEQAAKVNHHDDDPQLCTSSPSHHHPSIALIA